MVIDLLIPQEARHVLPGDQIVAITQPHFEQTLLEQEFAGIGLERLATHISLAIRLQLADHSQSRGPDCLTSSRLIIGAACSVVTIPLRYAVSP